ncbi:hypothetical protein NEOLEDRAFT_1184127 [Neolentinus lepideus HHB14362 ss-1]|uniref:Uncharacterized protein n=1 Tax=Neolentinus lepideus HHB14362 ss-1 TaxID=1314782 RepID=A0A165MQ59_9AGAM|nr:hypothetical protein NEOLEDRAFT_1184127 [Neolentinus lepideus HHB14362 ss-1]
MPSEECPTRSIRSATNKANSRPVENHRPTRSSLGGGDNIASASTNPPINVTASSHPSPPTRDRLETQTIIAHLPEDEDGSPLSPTTSTLLPDEEDAEFMDFESTPTPLRVHNPPTLISTALGSIPQQLMPPAPITSPPREGPSQPPPEGERSPTPEVRLVFDQPGAQPTYALVTASSSGSSSAVPARARNAKRAPVSPPTTVGIVRTAPVPSSMNPSPTHHPQAQTTAAPTAHTTAVLPQAQHDPMDLLAPVPAQPPLAPTVPTHPHPPPNAANALAEQLPPPVPAQQHADGDEVPVNPDVAALVNSYQNELQAINTHTAHQTANNPNSSSSAFTPPPPGGFPVTYRNSGAELFRNIAPAQLTALFSQPTPVLIVLPHNWNGRELATRGAEAAAHILSTAVAYSRATSNAPTDDIQVTMATPANPSGPNQPRVFFLRNLTQEVFTSMLERRVISHRRSTFQVYPVPVPEPARAIVLALAGFTSRDTQGIREALITLLQSAPLHDVIREVIQQEIYSSHETLTEIANDFAHSISLQRIDTRAPGGLITPRYILFARRPPGISSALWFQLRQALYDTTYGTALFGT